MKKSVLALRTAGFVAALTFGLTACGDDVTKYYDSEGNEISVTDTLLVTEVVKEQDTVKVSEIIKVPDTIKVTEVVTVYDTVSATEVIKTLDTVKTTIVVKDTIHDTIDVEVIKEAPVADLMYGTVDLSFAQFFYGEVNDVDGEMSATQGIFKAPSATTVMDGYDAFTSATTQKGARFLQANTEIVGETTEFKGLLKVDVAINKALYEDVMANGSESDASDLYKLVKAATWSDDAKAPVNYKVINADGSISKTYGAVSNRTPSTAILNAASAWGHYMVEFAAADVFEVTTDNIQAVVIEDEFGDKYGLIPSGHIWLQTREFAFSTSKFTEPHNCVPPYEQFAGLSGKRITKVTYFVKDNHNVSLNTDMFLPFRASVTAGKGNVTVTPGPRGNTTTISDFTTEGVTFTVGETAIFNVDAVNSAATLKLTAYGVTEGRNVNYTTIANGGTFSATTPYIVFDSSILPAAGGEFTFKFEDATGLQALTTVKVKFEAAPASSSSEAAEPEPASSSSAE